MPFRVVSGISRGMGVLDLDEYPQPLRGREISGFLNGVFECIFVFNTCVKS